MEKTIYGKPLYEGKLPMLKIKGLGNDENKTWFIFDKTVEFVYSISNLLSDLGFERSSLWYQASAKESEESRMKAKGFTFSSKDQYIDMEEDMNNFYESFEDDKYKIQIIYFKDQIELIVECEEKDKYFFIEKLKKIAHWKGW